MSNSTLSPQLIASLLLQQMNIPEQFGSNAMPQDGIGSPFMVADVKPLQLVNGQWVPSQFPRWTKPSSPYGEPQPRPQPRTGTDGDFQK